MFIALNRVTVIEGQGPALEAAFAKRGGQVNSAPGFISFHVLRPQQGSTYITMSVWDSKDDFQSWRNSPAFAESHRSNLQGIISGPPVHEGYEVIEGL